VAGLRILVVIAVAALALGLRCRAVELLPTDYDETPYLSSAQQLADVLRSGDLAALTAANLQPEHPQLMQLLFAAALLPAPASEPSPDRRNASGGMSKLPEAELLAARTASGVFGALEVLLLACLSPLAGLLLALHTYTIKYTSLVMLEALPAFTSLATVVSYQRFRRTQRRGWWIASGVLLGLSAAGKYMYAVVGVAILIDWGFALRSAPVGPWARLRPLLAWGSISLATFYAANPYFWPDPLWRLEFSLFYHAEYAGDGSPGGFPPWQPLVWLTTSLPQATARAAPQLYLLRLDPWISLLALLGLDRLWRKQRVYALWLAVGLLFLLVWNTKWPHYILILTAPLCLAAAEGAQRLFVGPLRGLLARRSGA
jgi:ABC-type transport system involved in cytochrome c biogenesis permease component